MSGFKGRLRKAEEAASVVHTPQIFCWLEEDESEQECIKRNGMEGVDPETVIFFAWAFGPPDLPLSGQQVSKETKPGDKEPAPAEGINS